MGALLCAVGAKVNEDIVGRLIDELQAPTVNSS